MACTGSSRLSPNGFETTFLLLVSIPDAVSKGLLASRVFGGANPIYWIWGRVCSDIFSLTIEGEGDQMRNALLILLDLGGGFFFFDHITRLNTITTTEITLDYTVRKDRVIQNYSVRNGSVSTTFLGLHSR